MLGLIDALLSTSPGEPERPQQGKPCPKCATPPRPAPCIGRDPLCPCQDGDSCHYVDTEDTKAWPIPMPPIEVGDSIVHGRPKEPVQFMYRVSEYERQGWQDDPNVIAVLRPIWTRTEDQ